MGLAGWRLGERFEVGREYLILTWSAIGVSYVWIGYRGTATDDLVQRQSGTSCKAPTIYVPLVLEG